MVNEWFGKGPSNRLAPSSVVLILTMSDETFCWSACICRWVQGKPLRTVFSGQVADCPVPLKSATSSS